MVKVLGIAVAAHALVAFALFSLVFLLPDPAGPFAAAAGAAFDLLAQPFAGPHRLLALPAVAEHAAAGVPWFLCSSATWAAAATLAVVAVRRRRAAA